MAGDRIQDVRVLCCIVVVTVAMSLGCSRKEPEGGSLAVPTERPGAGMAMPDAVAGTPSLQTAGASPEDPVDVDSHTLGNEASAGERVVDAWRNTAKEWGLRQSYLDCLDASSGATWELLDCIAHESEHQGSRLDSVYRKLQAELTRSEASQLVKEQEQWVRRRAKECAWDPETEGEGQMIDAKSCELDWTAARAKELEDRIRPER